MISRSILTGYTTAGVVAIALLAGACQSTPDDTDTPVPTTDADIEAAPSAGAESDSVSGQGESGDLNSPSGSRSPVDEVDWAPCDADLECGTVIAPVDYDDAQSGFIELSLIRRRATGDAEGSIFVNPGGPGASGVQLIRNGFRFDPDTEDRFHTVGFDPRAIGQSSPLRCFVDRADGPLDDLSPDSDAETAALDNEAEDIANLCRQQDGELLPHLTTINVARDLNQMRLAVGDDKLNFYGLSYGTLLAVRYAQLFPSETGRLVLDGVVAPDQLLTQLLTQQAEAFELGFAQLETRCQTDGPCPDDGLLAWFDRLHDRLEQSGPIDGVGSSELVVASLLPIYNPGFWTQYRQALHSADDGDMGDLERLSKFFTESISFTAYAAFACTDGGHEGGIEAWDAFAEDLHRRYLRFGAVVANELRTCSYWPRPDPDPELSAVIARSAASIPSFDALIIGVTADAATPLENAVNLADQIPDAHLVVVDGQRHTAYNGSQCVRSLVADFFADDIEHPGQSNCTID